MDPRVELTQVDTDRLLDSIQAHCLQGRIHSADHFSGMFKASQF